MSRPLAIFYHCLLAMGNPPDILPGAFSVVEEQMDTLRKSGLLDHASKFVVGINGGQESDELANLLLPAKAERVLHGLDSRSENLTILEIEKWVQNHPGWNVLYFHSKGATNSEDQFRIKWRRCMMRNLVIAWQRCVNDLERGYESVGCHWHTDMYRRSYWAGTFWWARSEFLQTVPSITTQPTVIKEGIASLNARYEAEVWIGGGKLPSHKDYHPEGFTKCL